MFEIEAVSLETLTHIEIGHDRKGHGAGLYIDKVIISEKVSPIEPKTLMKTLASVSAPQLFPVCTLTS
jgi:hypothetical protein